MLQRLNQKIKTDIENNFKQYLYLIILLIIGIILGLLLFNHSNEESKSEAKAYILKYFEQIKILDKANYFQIFKSSLISKLTFLAIIVVFNFSIFGTIVMSILFIFKGITLEYTISNIIYVYGTFKGSMLSVAMLLITNLIYLPLMIKVGVSTRKSYFNLINYNDDKKSIFTKNMMLILLSIVIIIIISAIDTFINYNLVYGISKKII